MTSLSPPPFPDPIFQSARRITGHVLTEIPQAEQPPTLERKTSVAGNILVIEDDSNSSKVVTKRAYSLQRKIKDSLHGSVRVGFELKQLPDIGPAMYELVPDLQNENGGNDDDEKRFKMVTIKISSAQGDTVGDTINNEVAALQWISNNAQSAHLLGPVVIGKDAAHIYTVSPYHKEGSLFDYCGRVGRLIESEARFLFRQILQVSRCSLSLTSIVCENWYYFNIDSNTILPQGLEDLKELEICHRGLDLDSILLKGTTCVLSNFDHALRIPVWEGQNAIIDSQEPHGKNPQSVAPELLKSEPFDGNAVDLWSAGIILFHMLLGGSALFDAPISEDPKFDEICIRSDLKGALQRWMPDEPHLSAEALDLLEKMLKTVPQKRLTLSAVRNHPWVTKGDCAAPSWQRGGE